MWRLAFCLAFSILPLAKTAVAQSSSPCTAAPSVTDYTSPQNQENANFANRCLAGANFTNVDLKGAKFNGADLTGANFTGADLGPGNTPASFANAILTQTNFQGAVLNVTDFQFARFDCTNFTGTSLAQANFGPAQTFSASTCRSQFNGATIDVHAIATGNWGLVDFTAANFQNLTPSTFNLAGTDITGAILAQTNFQGIDMTGANLSLVNFSGAILTGAVLDGIQGNGANFSGASLNLASVKCANFYAGAAMPATAKCSPPPSTPTTPTGANFQNAFLVGSFFSSTVLDYALLNGADLTSADFSNASLGYASLQAVPPIGAAIVSGTTFDKATLYGAQLSAVYFNYARLVSVSFAPPAGAPGVTLTGTSFNGAVMPNADFSNAILAGVIFQNAVLQNAKFDNAVLQSNPGAGNGAVDFTCAQLGGASFVETSVQGNTNFSNAVMPGAAGCCPSGTPSTGSTGGTTSQTCGTIGVTGQPYGATSLPNLTASVRCPDNGVLAICSATQWQIPNWTTTACSANGTSQVVWTPPNCTPPQPGPNVVFADMNLETCVLSSLPNSPTSISPAQAALMTSLSCVNKNIVNLSGLENFTGLRTLNLSGNKITTFAFGTGNLPFTQLNQLVIADNQLTQLNVSGLSKLGWLDASNNKLQSVTGTGNVHLLSLSLAGNALTTLDLAAQDQLELVDLSDNPGLTSVLDQYNLDLSRLKSLSYLDLSGNPLLPTIGNASTIAYSLKLNPTGKLKTLLLACSAAFQCGSLGLNPAGSGSNGNTYPAWQGSSCAQLNTTTNQWTPLSTPSCPGGG